MQGVFGDPIYIETLSEATFSSALAEIPNTKFESILLIAVDQDTPFPKELESLLSNSEFPIWGGVFPGIILAAQVKKSGALVIPIVVKTHIDIIENISQFPHSGKQLSFDNHDTKSALILTDGLTDSIEDTLEIVIKSLPSNTVVFGGGAGSLSFEKKPCLFTPKGTYQDAMLIVTMTQPWELVISHGWEILDGPFLANEVSGNEVIQLNFQPAIDIYSSVVEDHSKKSLQDTSFFDIAQTYPFGIDRLDNELLVRDPIKVENNHLVCVGDIPENTMLYILKGEPSSLIKATKDAATSRYANHSINNGFLFTCISRELFLKDRFQDELLGIAKPMNNNNPLIGVLALGEIASSVNGCVDFHNKTAVMAMPTVVN
ncbi:FIST C-terminal domain-containing protein [Alteromonas sp. 5E99-2]|uniref:FIST signal transduction protein n=1 Tax=Alteromonas sp. 5E99-2 TaxID=2817683 RepID=UPI001A99A62A|nr:FIST C-terminal domain-containing protein [Alteromonas sp. 5E99-2]MBO1257057.1 FIST C-terminal domain-containing protein [Alteromonas sp. 5E99-2]